MADIRLSKVPSGTNQSIACTPDSRFVFDFSTDEAIMTRSGDNLVFTFNDGGSIELTGFYTTYNSEQMPDFEVDGTTISGADFFTAMNEPDLMPAAGPATARIASGARYHEYADSSLMGGLDHLGGLDLGFDRAEESESDLYGFGVSNDDTSLYAENYGERVPTTEGGPNAPDNPDVPPTSGEPNVPGNPGIPPSEGEPDIPDAPDVPPTAGEPNVPDNPDVPPVEEKPSVPDDSDDDQNHEVTITPETPDPEVPGDPEAPADPANPATQGASVTVYEAGLKGGTQEGANEAPTKAEGVLVIDAPDDVKSIELSFGGETVTVSIDGSGSTINTDEGTLTVSYADGKLSYSYELTGNTIEHTSQGKDTFSHDITVKVTDRDGDEATSTIRVNVVDDVASAADDVAEVTRDGATSAEGNVLGNDTFGADGQQEAASLAWNVDGLAATSDEKGGYIVETAYGTLTLDAYGNYSFELDNNSEALVRLKDGSASIEVPYTIRDADGDISMAKLTLTVNGHNHGVTITPDGESDPVDPSDPSIPGASVTVYEAGLKGGTQEGADEAPTKAEGVMVIDAPDDVKSIELSFGGETVTVSIDGSESTINTGEGTLTVSYANGKLGYSYELIGNTTEHTSRGKDTFSHDITVKVTDRDGDEATSTIRVNVVDDVPILHLEQTGSGEYGKGMVIGSLATIYGADGEGAGESLSIMLDGKAASKTDNGLFSVDGIGTIKIEDNGDIVFTPYAKSGAGASHTLAVTITDSDHDTATDKITFSVTDTDLSKLSGHAVSSDARLAESNDVTVEGLPEGAMLVNGTYQGLYGDIIVEDGKISYIQSKTFWHQVKGEENKGIDVAEGAEQLRLLIKLGDGSDAIFTVSVDITDDVPYGGSVRHDVARGDEIKGNIFDPDNANPATAGADGLATVEWKLPDGWAWTDGSTGIGSGKAYCIDRPLLSVELKSDGSYTFMAQDNLGGIGGSIAFDHFIYDRDGDWSEGKLDFNPSANGDISPLPKELEVTVSEAALPGGSQTSPEEGGDGPGAGVRLEIPAGYTVAEGGMGEYGHVVQNPDGSWSYELTTTVSNVFPIDGDAGQDIVTLTLKDAQGIEHEVDVKVTILDDAPIIKSAEGASVVPVSGNVFPDGQFDFTFGDHTEFKSHSRDLLGYTQGWEPKDGGFSALDLSSGLLVYGGMYKYTESQHDGYIGLDCDKQLGVFYSASGEKYGDHESVSQGKQDGLTVGEVETWADKSYSQFEIGAAPNENRAEGICFDLQGQIAHSVTVTLGAFFSAGGDNDWGQVYDPIPERALLTFYDDKGSIVKQMEVQADSLDGQYTESIDCYVAGGFTKFVVSALDNVKWAKDHGIEYNGNADSDFVVQSVDFHKIIGTATGKVSVMSGADGLHESMNDYVAFFDLDSMQKAFGEQLNLVQEGEAGFLAKDGDKVIFAAEIDKSGEWTLTQFNHFDGDREIELKFYTQDGDGDRRTADVNVNLYHGEDEVALLSAHSDSMDADNYGLLFDSDAPLDDASDDLIVYDPTDYLVHGGDGIDFLLSGNDKDIHLQSLLDNKNPADGPLIRDVEVLLKGDDIDGLTSLKELQDYGITVEDNTLSLSKDWSASDGAYTYKSEDGKSFTLETTLTGKEQTDGSIAFTNALVSNQSGEEGLRTAIGHIHAETGGSC